MDKTKMGNQVGKTLREDWGKILTSERYKVVVPSGVCSDHASKAPGDCCRKTTRKTTKEDSQKDS
jgi:hypothetical protein